jgi:hypothetical protein
VFLKELFQVLGDLFSVFRRAEQWKETKAGSQVLDRDDFVILMIFSALCRPGLRTGPIRPKWKTFLSERCSVCQPDRFQR